MALAPLLDSVNWAFHVALPIAFVLILWALSLFSSAAANAVYKLHLGNLGVRHLLLSTDKKWKKQPDSGTLSSADVKKTKRVIFIRHGESEWNLVFNKGFGPSFFFRLGRALVRELLLATSLDSVFVDSPLSRIGISQAVNLHAYVEDGGTASGILRGDSSSDGSAVVVASNLRRAVSTASIGLAGRLQRTREKVHILSCLQEISTNVDTVSLAKAKTAPALSSAELEALRALDVTLSTSGCYDARGNVGDKPVRGSGMDRIQEFAKYIFDSDKSCVIAAGHSLYFKHFFRTFLPSSSTHISKSKKMKNCAVVAFDFQMGMNGHFRIEPESIESMYLGFEGDGHVGSGKKDK